MLSLWILLCLCSCLAASQVCLQLHDQCPCVDGTVNCTSQQLTEMLPFGEYTGNREVKTLLINNNTISRLPKNAFKGLEVVSKISVSDNSLTEISDNAFSDVSSLSELHMDSCDLSSVPAAITQLTSLEKLFMQQNRISSLPSSVFHHLTSLKELHLAGNSIQFVSSFDAFSNLNKLELLDLSSNNLHSISVEVLHSLSALRVLHLEDNHIRTLPENIFENNSELTALYFMNNELIFADGNVLVDNKETLAHDVTVFKNLPKLQVLLLSHCRITSLDKEMFASKPNLKNLGFSYCDFAHIEDGAFDDVIERLEALDVSGSVPLWQALKNTLNNGNNLKQLKMASLNLTDIPTAVFQNLNKLVLLNMENNMVKKLKAGAFKGIKGVNAKIHLEANQIADVSPYVLRGMSPPLSLYLNDNHLKTVDFIEQNPCSFDRSLIDVTGNEIKCDCVTAKIAQRKMTDLVGTCNPSISDEYSGLNLSPMIGSVLKGDNVYLEEKAALVCKLEKHNKEKYDCCNSKWVSIGTPSACMVMNAAQGVVPYGVWVNTILMLIITLLFSLFQ